MKNVIFYACFVLLFGCGRSVYVCNGPDSQAYHKKKKCMGLSHCSTELEKISREQAEAKGRHLCSFEK